MTITARSITTNNTLEQLRNQFNNLVADVDGLETGTKAFSTITSTTSSSTTINVLEDGTIVFEGATDDNFETTLTAADPTADRTITFPDSSGTVVVSGTGGLTVADGGNIGSDSDTDAISISSAGVVSFSATTANTNASDGAVTIAGGLGVAADASIGDDLRLISDSAVLSFGADSDTTLTHTDGTGLTLNGTNKLTFGDTASFVQQSSDGTLRIDGEATIDLNASSKVDISDNLQVNGGGVSILNKGARSYVRLYCESANAHYVEIKAPAHADFSGNVTVVFPNEAGTLVTSAQASDDATALAIALG